MEPKKIAMVDKIYRLAQQDPEFSAALRAKLAISTIADTATIPHGLKEDVRTIREVLEMRANCSISYDFVSNVAVRQQLLIDNLRMENVVLNLKLADYDRFTQFCLNAFYQVENILKYYYDTVYPRIGDLVEVIEKSTQEEQEKFRYKPTGKEISADSIATSTLLDAFCNTNFVGEKSIKITLARLRNGRNDISHRGRSAEKQRESKDMMRNLYAYQTYGSIRDCLRRVVMMVKDCLRYADK